MNNGWEVEHATFSPLVLSATGRPIFSTRDWPPCSPPSGITPTAALYAGSTAVYPSPFWDPPFRPSEAPDHHADAPSGCPWWSTWSTLSLICHQHKTPKTFIHLLPGTLFYFIYCNFLSLLFLFGLVWWLNWTFIIFWLKFFFLIFLLLMGQFCNNKGKTKIHLGYLQDQHNDSRTNVHRCHFGASQSGAWPGFSFSSFFLLMLFLCPTQWLIHIIDNEGFSIETWFHFMLISRTWLTLLVPLQKSGK